jgi:hypothetical protein
MRKALLVCCFILLMPFGVSAQNSLCQIDLSSITATLTRAQAAAARGEADQALALIAQADEALNLIESRCDLPTITAAGTLEETFVSDDASFAIQYPAGWSITPSENGSSIVVGTDSAAAETLQTAEPTLNPGQQGVLIVFGTPAVITGNQPVDASLEGVIRYFQAQLATFYLVRGSPQYFMLNGRLASQFEFTGDGFDGLMIIVELAEGTQYAVVAGAAAKGELEEFRPTIESMAASATQEG